jgi:CRP/FNR family transcriptional regulator
MLTTDQFNRIHQAFPLLQTADEALLRDFQNAAFFARIPAGRDVFVEGDQADAIALLLSGSVRVYKIGENGREITLYRFGHGESCILTANAILSRRSFPAIATVERDAEAIMLPAEAFQTWVGRYEAWRTFVFRLMSDRLSLVMAIVDDVVFRRMDRRVAAFLLTHANPEGVWQGTHQQIAAELGSSREVISRILEDLASDGLLEAGRGSVVITDRARLESRAVM